MPSSEARSHSRKQLANNKTYSRIRPIRASRLGLVLLRIMADEMAGGWGYQLSRQDIKDSRLGRRFALFHAPCDVEGASNDSRTL
jgi:hypothetical protein